MFARYLPPEFSGAAAQALLLAARLRRRGHQVEFVTQSWTGQAGTYETDGFSVTALHARPSPHHQEFGDWRSLARHLWQRRRAIDILHGHGAYYIQSVLGPLGRLLGKPTLLKVSLSNNDLSSLSNRAIAPVHRQFLRLIDAYVAISDDLEQELRASGLPRERIRHIPNGVDTTRFAPVDADGRADAAAQLGLPRGRRLALFVGVFDERKHIAWLAEQWIANAGFGTAAILVAVGPTSRERYGEQVKAHLHALARQHPGLLIVRDYTAAIEQYYRAVDLLVFPSHNEGLPNAVLEAMASGLPCVVARACGSRELVRDGVNGATFAIDDVGELRAALARVTGEQGLQLGAASRRIVLERFDIEHIAGQYEALYRQLCARRARPAARAR